MSMIWWFSRYRSEVTCLDQTEKMTLVMLFVWLLLDFKQFNCWTNHAHRFTRVRRLAIDIEPKLAFDMELVLPFPMFDGVDVAVVVHVPFVISIHDFDFQPSKDSDQMGPHGSSSGKMAVSENERPLSTASYRPEYQGTFMPAFYQESMLMDSHNRTDQARLDPRKYSSLYYEKYRRAKRQLRVASAIHRYDIFTSFSNSLSKLGLNGHACVCKAICQLARTPMLIESVLHEVLEIVLSVSRSGHDHLPLAPFLEAERLGRTSGKCEEKYSCPFSIFEIIDESHFNFPS